MPNDAYPLGLPELWDQMAAATQWTLSSFNVVESAVNQTQAFRGP